MSNFDGQPAAAVVYGTETNAADLSLYRDEILAVVATPEPGAWLLCPLGGACLFLRRTR